MGGDRSEKRRKNFHKGGGVFGHGAAIKEVVQEILYAFFANRSQRGRKKTKGLGKEKKEDFGKTKEENAKSGNMESAVERIGAKARENEQEAQVGEADSLAEAMAWRLRIARFAASMNANEVAAEIQRCPKSVGFSGGLVWWNEVTHLAKTLAEEGQREQGELLMGEAMASENFLTAAATAIDSGGANPFLWLRWGAVGSRALEILGQDSPERERAARIEGIEDIARSWASDWAHEAAAFFGSKAFSWLAGAKLECASAEQRRVLSAWIQAAAAAAPDCSPDEVLDRARQSLEGMIGANVVDLADFHEAIDELLAPFWMGTHVWASALAALIERAPAGERASAWAVVSQKIEEKGSDEKNTALILAKTLAKAKQESIELREVTLMNEKAGGKIAAARI
jgi:hypothetical protein